MIRLSNGHSFEYMAASGALGFDGKGWPWEWPLRWVGLMKPKLFTVVIKTLTHKPTKGNFSLWKPWTYFPGSPWACVRLWRDNSILNKVGLSNPGIDWWCKKIGPGIEGGKIRLVGSIHGTEEELVDMTKKLNMFDLVGVEVNVSCPNVVHDAETQMIVNAVRKVKEVSVHPVIIKVSVKQEYLKIAAGLHGCAEAISLNSVPFRTVYPPKTVFRSPLEKLRPCGTGGGVSGRLAQRHNWKAVRQLAKLPHGESLPIIGPSVMKLGDLDKVRRHGASAISFGAIHVRTPWKPTLIVQADKTLSTYRNGVVEHAK